MKQWEKFVKRCDFTLRDAAQTYTREVGGLSFFSILFSIFVRILAFIYC